MQLNPRPRKRLAICALSKKGDKETNRVGIKTLRKTFAVCVGKVDRGERKNKRPKRPADDVYS